jgi:hypothetical protein
MAMADPDLTLSKPHDEAEELLPWYATGQLDENDRDRLEAHLSCCAHCRQQLDLERRLVREFRAIEPEVESGWSRLRSRIDAPVIRARPRVPTIFDQFLAIIRRPAVAGLAIAQVAFLIVASSILIVLSRPAYQTLGSSTAPASANVIVMFRPEANVQDIDELLKSAGASIVDGPTDTNAYLLHVAPKERQLALVRLQANDEVQLAQPIDGTAR